MDWMRRNWPDLLIGLALVAVIAGIIATLMSGGSLLPMGRSETPSRVANPNSRTTPAPTNQNTSGSAVSPGAGAAQDEGDLIIPILPDIGGNAQAQQERPVGQADTSQPTAGANRSEAGAAASPQASGQRAGDDEDFGVSPRSQAPFRVSAGAFGVASYATAQLERLQAAGYPVFTGRQGDLYLVMVGPYPSQSEAEAAAARLTRDELVTGPLVYQCTDCGASEGSSPAGTSQASTSQAGASQASTSQASTPRTSNPAVPAEPAVGDGGANTASNAAPGQGGSRYLQVGAYATLESSEPQRERLQDLGYAVTVRQSSNFVKLLIGPFDGGELATARQRLEGQGIENFPTP